MTPPDKTQPKPQEIPKSPASDNSDAVAATAEKLFSDVKEEDYSKFFKMYQSAAETPWGKKALEQFNAAGQMAIEFFDSGETGHDPAPLMSGAAMGAALDRAYHSALAANGGKPSSTMLDNSELKDILARSAQDAFQKGGAVGLRQYLHDVNTNIPTEHFGPIAHFEGSAIGYNSSRLGSFADLKNDSTVTIKLDGPGDADVATPMEIRIGGDLPAAGSVDSADAGDTTGEARIESTLPKDPNATVAPSGYVTGAVLNEFNKLRPGSVWSGTTGDAQAIASTQSFISELGRLPVGVLKAKGATTADAINQWLSDQGSPLKLDDAGAALYSAAIASIQGKWDGKEVASISTPDGTSHPALALDNKPEYLGERPAVHFFDVPGQDAPLVQIYEDPDTGMKVYAMEDSEPRPGLDGSEFSRQLLEDKTPDRDTNYGGVVLPMMNYQDSGNLDQFTAVHNQFGDSVSQALYALDIQTSPGGFKMRTEAAASATRGGGEPPPPPRYVMGENGKPIRLIVQAAGTTYPLMTFVVSPDHWSDPR
jgi:hypothetical protein